MAYDKKISRAEPGLIGVNVDDSGSMVEKLPGTQDEKYKWVERDFGFILKEMLAKSTEMKGQTAVIKPRYYVHTIRYGGTPQLWGEEEMDIQATVEKYTQAGNSLGLGGNLGGTDTKASFEKTYEYLQRAVGEDRFRNSFPPMVFHISDGQSWTDPLPVADSIKQLSTRDGNVLLVNAYIGTQTSLNYKGPEDFPGYCSPQEAGPNSDNLRMFNMSSEVPETIRQNLIDDDIFPNMRQGARLFFDVRTKEMLKNVIQVVGSVGSRADRQMK